MSRNIDKTPILYSVGTKLAYKINKRYYGGVHYVWCADSFNSKEQPPTSNPCTIIKRFLEQISSGDRHTYEIDNNKAGILKGARAKLNAGVIDNRQYREIRNIVSVADLKAFFPVLYIMETSKVRHKCEEVPIKDRASDESFEYKITSLEEGEYQIVDFETVLIGLIKIADEGVLNSMAKLKVYGTPNGARYKAYRRAKRAHAYKMSSVLGSASNSSTKHRQSDRTATMCFPMRAMTYEDVLEVSRLTEVLLKGGDISQIPSNSRTAKDFVMNVRRANKGMGSVEKLYNQVNKRLVLMNKGENHPNLASVKLYNELMSD